MLNHITIMGRLTRDPELRYTGSNVPVASFAVAVDRDQAPEGQEKETDFIDCVAWRQTGEFVSKYFTKGSMIVVSGRLQIRNWTDKDGNKRRSAEVAAENCYFGEGRKDSQQPQENRNNQAGSNPNPVQNGWPGAAGNAQGYGQQSNMYPQQQGYGYQQQGFGGYQGYGEAPKAHYPLISGDDPRFPWGGEG